MLYKEFIQEIIDKRGQWNEEVYSQGCEMHHIIPLCMGGEGDYKTSSGDWIFKERSRHENCIYLTYEEHFRAHELLKEENPGNKKLLHAFWLMAHPKMSNGKRDKNYKIGSKKYSKLREEFIESISGENNPMYGVNVWEMYSDEKRKEVSEKISKSSKGKLFSLETRKKLSENNSMNKPEYRKKVSDALKGHEVSAQTREKISKTKKSQNRHLSPEQKLQTSLRFKGKKLSPERCQKMSKAQRGIHKKKFKWLLPDGTIKEMDKGNAKKYHQDWIMVEED